MLTLPRIFSSQRSAILHSSLPRKSLHRQCCNKLYVAIYFAAVSCISFHAGFMFSCFFVCFPVHGISTYCLHSIAPLCNEHNIPQCIPTHCFCITIHIVFALQFILFLHYIPMQHLTREKGEQARRGARGLRGGTNSYQGGVGAFCIRSHHC